MPKHRSTVGERPDYRPTLQEHDLVLAVDPGLTTGIAVMRVDRFAPGNFTVVLADEVPWDDRFSLVRYVRLAQHVVIESFRLYAHKARDQINASFPSAQVIGIVDAFAHQEGKLECIKEQPASLIAKVQVLDEHMHYVKGSEHRKDAYKHGRLFVTLMKKGWPLQD